MPVDRATFDADLQNYITNVSNYITAVNAFIGMQQVLDLSAEDSEVQTALQAVQTAQGQIPTPPAKPAS